MPDWPEFAGICQNEAGEFREILSRRKPRIPAGQAGKQPSVRRKNNQEECRMKNMEQSETPDYAGFVGDATPETITGSAAKYDAVIGSRRRAKERNAPINGAAA